MPKIEPKLYDFLRKKMIETPEGLVHAVCDIENHVHIAITVRQTGQLTERIGQLKGASANFINQNSNRKLLERQHGYGVVGFDTKDLTWIVN